MGEMVNANATALVFPPSPSVGRNPQLARDGLIRPMSELPKQNGARDVAQRKFQRNNLVYTCTRVFLRFSLLADVIHALLRTRINVGRRSERGLAGHRQAARS